MRSEIKVDGMRNKVRRSEWQALMSVQTVMSIEYLWRRATHGEKPACKFRK
jgi:hypothetical protein